MGIERDEVFRIARLAHIDLTEAEAKALPEQLDRIVDYVRSLEAVATEGIRESHAAPPTPLRADAAEGMAPCLPPGAAAGLAPERSGDLIAVPRVIGGDDGG